MLSCTVYIFLQIRFCTSCSAKQRRSAKFCWKCGCSVQCDYLGQSASTSKGPNLSFGSAVISQEKSTTMMTMKMPTGMSHHREIKGSKAIGRNSEETGPAGG